MGFLNSLSPRAFGARCFRNYHLCFIVLVCYCCSCYCLPKFDVVQGFESPNGPSWDWVPDLLISLPNSEGVGKELASLKFKSSWRSRREVPTHELYPHGEVLELRRPSSDSPLAIRLERRFLVDPSFTFHAPEEDAERDTSEHVVYSGKIHETTGSEREIGAAALSICGDSGGLCGLLMLGNEHLLIQPHPRQVAASEPDSVELDHVHVLATLNASELASSLVNDELRVPAAKLAAAYDDRVRQKDTRRTPPRRQPTLLVPLEPDLSTEIRPSLRMQPPKYTKPLPLSVKNGNRAGSDLKKKVIEIAVFTDQDLYEKMKKRFPKDTVQKMKDYVVTMINTMDLLYQHKSLGVPIEFSLVHLEIMKKYPAKLNKNGGKAMAYLSSFCDYAGEKNVNGEMWDHALMLTGMDLREDGTTSTAGLAWAGTMCYRYYSCSISEGNSFGTAYIITHEIGHSLGMEHDGMGVSETCDKDKYLMSPTTGPGKVEWSSCSKKNLEEFLRYGSAELRRSNRPHVPECLNESKRTSHSKIEVAADSNNLPGKRYDASQQCVLAMGSRFKPVLRKTEPPFDNVCWMLYCGNGTHAISTHPALEGTKCDDAKHCRSGKCVKA